MISFASQLQRIQRLIALVRVSTEGQSGPDRAGPDRQVATIKATAKSVGVAEDHIHWVSLADVSGSDVSLTREWQEEILPLLDDPGTHIIVEHLFRLIRADRFNFDCARDLEATASLVILPGAIHDPKTNEGMMAIVLGGMMGGIDKRTIKANNWGSKEEKRKRGEFPQSHICLATGIDYDRERKCWSLTDDAWKVRRAFELFVTEGVHCYAEIGREVGHPGETVKLWLTNPVYKGWMIYDKKRGEDFYDARVPGRQRDRRKVQRVAENVIEVQVFGREGQQPPLVSEEDWDKAQVVVERMRTSRQRRRREASQHTPYARFLYSVHGEPTFAYHRLYGRGCNGLRDARYECRCRRTKPDDLGHPRCALARLPADQLNKAINVLLDRVVNEPWFMNEVLLPQFRSRGPQVERDLERADAAVKVIKKEKKRLRKLFRTNKITLEEFDEDNRELEDELLVARRALAAAKDRRLALGVSDQETRVRAYVESLGRFDPSHPAGFRQGFVERLVPEIVVSDAGIELLGFTLPQGLNGAIQPFVVAEHIPWTDLLGYDLFDIDAHLASEGLYTTAMLAKRLGRKPADVRYLMRQGVLPRGSKMYRKGSVFTLAEVEEIERNLAEREAPPVYRWGLPRKDFYTFGDLRKVTGLSGEELRYRLEKGVLPDGETRTEHGYRKFTEQEFARAVETWERINGEG